MGNGKGPGFLAVAAVVSLGLCGCSGGGTTESGAGAGGAPPMTPTQPTTDVYVAGQISSSPDVPRATLWKNGTPILLGEETGGSGACCVVVSGTDVYAAGTQNYGAQNVAVIWKNGVVTRLTDGTGEANVLGLAVVGDDVYASGYDRVTGRGSSAARLWKNGQTTILPDKGSGALAYGLTVSGADVYVTGWVQDRSHTYDSAPFSRCVEERCAHLSRRGGYLRRGACRPCIRVRSLSCRQCALVSSRQHCRGVLEEREAG